MPGALPFFTQGSASAASQDVIFAGIAQTASPLTGSDLGDSAFTIFTDKATVNGDASQQRLAQASSQRGRQYELDTIQPGQATVLFRNPDGNLDPQNISSPYYPNLQPLKRFRLVRCANGVRYPLWDGLIERFVPQYVVPKSSDGIIRGYQDVEVGGVDAFEILTNALLATGQQSVEYDDPFSNAGPPKILFTAKALGVSPVTVEIKCVQANDSLQVVVTGTAILIHLATNASNQGTSTCAQVVTAVNSSAAASALVTASSVHSGTFFNQGPQDSGVLTMSGGAWPIELSGTRINRVLDYIGWPSTARNVDPGLYQVVSELFGLLASANSQMGALQHAQDVSTGELGYVFMAADGDFTYHDGDHRTFASRSQITQATFTDAGSGGIPYQSLTLDYSRDHVANDVVVTAGSNGAVAQEVSVASVDRRSLSLSTKLVADADALAVANNILTSRQNPTPRIASLVTRDNGTTGWLQCLGLEIGDRIVVISNPPAQNTSITYTCFVENIQHSLVAGQPHTVTFQLTQISASSGGGGGDGSGAILNNLGTQLILDDPTNGLIG